MILHLDMDAFYASVEIRDQPSLQGLPVVVGGSPQGRGVVSAASYEARRYGVHSAMPAAQVLRVCPQAVFLRPRMAHYAAVSRQIRAIFEDFTTLVEPLSLDEAFLDVSGSLTLFGDAVSIARTIKARIRDELGLTASAGVAPNKYLAKLASDLQKPDGLVVVPADGVEAFLAPLAVSRVWGVGKQTQKKLEQLGIRTMGQLRQWPREALQQSFGATTGDHFWRLARGEDARPVVVDRAAKSISHETTFAADIEDYDALHAWTGELCDQVARRLRRHSRTCRTVKLKLRYANFETVTRAVTLHQPTHSTSGLSAAARDLLAPLRETVRRGVRLLGVGVAQLSAEGQRQLPLFPDTDADRDRQLDSATDAIRGRFGSQALQRGGSLQLPGNHGSRDSSGHRPPEKRG